MKPLAHFIASTLLFGMLFPVYGFWALLVYFSGFLIDADHYIYWIFKFKNFNLVENYIYHTKKNRVPLKNMLHIFHVIEFWVLAGLIAVLFYGRYEFAVFPLLMGSVVHLAMDFAWELYIPPKQKRAMSLIEWIANLKHQ